MIWLQAHLGLLGFLLGTYALIAALISKSVWPKPEAPPKPRWHVVAHFVLIDWPAALPSRGAEGRGLVVNLFGLPLTIPLLSWSQVLSGPPSASEDAAVTTGKFSRPPVRPDAGMGRLDLLVVLAGAVALTLCLGGCPTTLGGQAALAGWEHCEMNQLPSIAEGVLVDVSGALGGADWKPQLEQLGIRAGASQVDCAVQALVSYLETKIPAHGQPDPATLVKIDHGKAWLARGK